MKKKIVLGIAAAGSALAMLPMFAAFEAHVINVTATIENALTVPLKYIDYGTVFPQEELDEFFGISLSQSFIDEDRVDDVQYMIRQKPKCAITNAAGTTFDATVGQDGRHRNTRTGHINVVLGDDPSTPGTETNFPIATIDCGEPPRELEGDEVWGVLPNLCPYLSKHKGSDGLETNEVEIPAFHNPYTLTIGTTTISWLEAIGYLSKDDQDTRDDWKLDLKVPCFGGFCAQDWADFVHEINPNADPDDYTQPIANEHKVFGCDLWIEVSGVSKVAD